MKTKRGNDVPKDIAHAILADETAIQGFEQMPPSHQEEFLSYILEAKLPETRARRIKLSVAAIKKWYADRAERMKKSRMAKRA
ncbi:MAG: YdeI/OmpD-associated family protein [Candidatus Kerfeldbacteria bacterium]|nr:YdeI/OmpD-associated family protein [Candidatus Kerfeldbacteria bacterium]